MAKNDLTLLDAAIAERQASRDAPLPGDIALEVFAAEQILRSYELSDDEISSGRVGGGNDGGLDGIYVFLGESLLSDDHEIYDEERPSLEFARDQTLALWLIQAKTSQGFSETAVDLVASSLMRLLDLQYLPDELASLYNDAVVDKTRLFTNAWKKLSTRRPRLAIRFAYATRGDTSSIDAKVRTKADELVNEIKALVPDCDARVEFWGAAELWNRVRRAPNYTLQLAYHENATSTDSHVALVTLHDYFNVITDEVGALRRHIFDWNVRDYQGDVEVNTEIKASVLDEQAPEFWWLNNGVTIICSKATVVGKTYVLEDVQIVNGLQTSHALYSVLGQAAKDSNAWGRSILIRILATEDKAVRDKVIRATNRQTSVSAASLRATDDIQRKIESYFLTKSWYYDRRKNYYRNLNKPADRIVSIPLLAQSMMAMGLAQPDSSRARPSSLLKNDDDYRRIFNDEIDLEIYLWVAQTQAAVDKFLITNETKAADRSNFRFYLSTVLVTQALKKAVRNPVELRPLAAEGTTFPSTDMAAGLEALSTWMTKYAKTHRGSDDQIAKSRAWAEHVLTQTIIVSTGHSTGQ